MVIHETAELLGEGIFESEKLISIILVLFHRTSEDMRTLIVSENILSSPCRPKNANSFHPPRGTKAKIGENFRIILSVLVLRLLSSQDDLVDEFPEVS